MRYDPVLAQSFLSYYGSAPSAKHFLDEDVLFATQDPLDLSPEVAAALTVSLPVAKAEDIVQRLVSQEAVNAVLKSDKRVAVKLAAVRSGVFEPATALKLLKSVKAVRDPGKVFVEIYGKSAALELVSDVVASDDSDALNRLPDQVLTVAGKLAVDNRQFSLLASWLLLDEGTFPVSSFGESHAVVEEFLQSIPDKTFCALLLAYGLDPSNPYTGRKTPGYGKGFPRQLSVVFTRRLAALQDENVVLDTLKAGYLTDNFADLLGFLLESSSDPAKTLSKVALSVSTCSQNFERHDPEPCFSCITPRIAKLLMEAVTKHRVLLTSEFLELVVTFLNTRGFSSTKFLFDMLDENLACKLYESVILNRVSLSSNYQVSKDVLLILLGSVSTDPGLRQSILQTADSSKLADLDIVKLLSHSEVALYVDPKPTVALASTERFRPVLSFYKELVYLGFDEALDLYQTLILENIPKYSETVLAVEAANFCNLVSEVSYRTGVVDLEKFLLRFASSQVSSFLLLFASLPDGFISLDRSALENVYKVTEIQLGNWVCSQLFSSGPDPVSGLFLEVLKEFLLNHTEHANLFGNHKTPFEFYMFQALQKFLSAQNAAAIKDILEVYLRVGVLPVFLPELVYDIPLRHLQGKSSTSKTLGLLVAHVASQHFESFKDIDAFLVLSSDMLRDSAGSLYTVGMLFEMVEKL